MFLKKHLLSLFLLLSIPAHAMEQPDNADTVPEKKENITKTEIATACFPQVHFSPGIQDVLLNLIDHEQHKIISAMFQFTLYKMADAIVQKKKNNNVEAALIVNHGFQNSSCEALKLLSSNGVNLFQNNQPLDRVAANLGQFEHMHHKFIVFGKNINNKPLVVTGSFNCTGQANLKNSENIVILDDDKNITSFIKEWNTIREGSTPIKPEECVSSKPTGTFAKKMNDIPKA